MRAERVREFLMSRGVSYETDSHPVTYTAQELAAVEHVSGREVAKPVVLKVDDRMVMAVLPATERVSIEKAREALHGEVRLASEDEFAELFPDCEKGAEPPFGNLYELPVYMDERFDATSITFNAGTHTEAIRMSVEDYRTLVHPAMVDIAG